MAAVELLLDLGYRWNDGKWEAPARIEASLQAAGVGEIADEIDAVAKGLHAAWQGTGEHMRDGTHSADLWEWKERLYRVWLRVRATPPAAPGEGLSEGEREALNDAEAYATEAPSTLRHDIRIVCAALRRVTGEAKP